MSGPTIYISSIHTKSAGDTLRSISEQHDVPVSGLQRSNNITGQNISEVEEFLIPTEDEVFIGGNGQVITRHVPQFLGRLGIDETDISFHYIVSHGETIGDILDTINQFVDRRHKITLPDFIRANDQYRNSTSDTPLLAGKEINIPILLSQLDPDAYSEYVLEEMDTLLSTGQILNVPHGNHELTLFQVAEHLSHKGVFGAVNVTTILEILIEHNQETLLTLVNAEQGSDAEAVEGPIDLNNIGNFAYVPLQAFSQIIIPNQIDDFEREAAGTSLFDYHDNQDNSSFIRTLDLDKTAPEAITPDSTIIISRAYKMLEGITIETMVQFLLEYVYNGQDIHFSHLLSALLNINGISNRETIEPDTMFLDVFETNSNSNLVLNLPSVDDIQSSERMELLLVPGFEIEITQAFIDRLTTNDTATYAQRIATEIQIRQNLTEEEYNALVIAIQTINNPNPPADSTPVIDPGANLSAGMIVKIPLSSEIGPIEVAEPEEEPAAEAPVADGSAVADTSGNTELVLNQTYTFSRDSINTIALHNIAINIKAQNFSDNEAVTDNVILGLLSETNDWLTASQGELTIAGGSTENLTLVIPAVTAFTQAITDKKVYSISGTTLHTASITEGSNTSTIQKVISSWNSPDKNLAYLLFSSNQIQSLETPLPETLTIPAHSREVTPELEDLGSVEAGLSYQYTGSPVTLGETVTALEIINPDLNETELLHYFLVIANDIQEPTINPTSANNNQTKINELSPTTHQSNIFIGSGQPLLHAAFSQGEIDFLFPNIQPIKGFEIRLKYLFQGEGSKLTLASIAKYLIEANYYEDVSELSIAALARIIREQNAPTLDGVSNLEDIGGMDVNTEILIPTSEMVQGIEPSEKSEEEPATEPGNASSIQPGAEIEISSLGITGEVTAEAIANKLFEMDIYINIPEKTPGKSRGPIQEFLEITYTEFDDTVVLPSQTQVAFYSRQPTPKVNPNNITSTDIGKLVIFSEPSDGAIVHFLSPVYAQHEPSLNEGSIVRAIEYYHNLQEHRLNTGQALDSVQALTASYHYIPTPEQILEIQAKFDANVTHAIRLEDIQLGTVYPLEHTINPALSQATLADILDGGLGLREKYQKAAGEGAVADTQILRAIIEANQIQVDNEQDLNAIQNMRLQTLPTTDGSTLQGKTITFPPLTEVVQQAVVTPGDTVKIQELGIINGGEEDFDLFVYLLSKTPYININPNDAGVLEAFKIVLLNLNGSLPEDGSLPDPSTTIIIPSQIQLALEAPRLNYNGNTESLTPESTGRILNSNALQSLITAPVIPKVHEIAYEASTEFTALDVFWAIRFYGLLEIDHVPRAGLHPNPLFYKHDTLSNAFSHDYIPNLPIQVVSSAGLYLPTPEQILQLKELRTTQEAAQIPTTIQAGTSYSLQDNPELTIYTPYEIALASVKPTAGSEHGTYTSGTDPDAVLEALLAANTSFIRYDSRILDQQSHRRSNSLVMPSQEEVDAISTPATEVINSLRDTFTFEPGMSFVLGANPDKVNLDELTAKAMSDLQLSGLDELTSNIFFGIILEDHHPLTATTILTIPDLDDLRGPNVKNALYPVGGTTVDLTYQENNGRRPLDEIINTLWEAGFARDLLPNRQLLRYAIVEYNDVTIFDTEQLPEFVDNGPFKLPNQGDIPPIQTLDKGAFIDFSLGLKGTDPDDIVPAIASTNALDITLQELINKASETSATYPMVTGQVYEFLVMHLGGNFDQATINPNMTLGELGFKAPIHMHSLNAVNLSYGSRQIHTKPIKGTFYPYNFYHQSIPEQFVSVFAQQLITDGYYTIDDDLDEFRKQLSQAIINGTNNTDIEYPLDIIRQDDSLSLYIPTQAEVNGTTVEAKTITFTLGKDTVIRPAAIDLAGAPTANQVAERLLALDIYPNIPDPAPILTALGQRNDTIASSDNSTFAVGADIILPTQIEVAYHASIAEWNSSDNVSTAAGRVFAIPARERAASPLGAIEVVYPDNHKQITEEQKQRAIDYYRYSPIDFTENVNSLSSNIPEYLIYFPKVDEILEIETLHQQGHAILPVEITPGTEQNFSKSPAVHSRPRGELADIFIANNIYPGATKYQILQALTQYLGPPPITVTTYTFPTIEQVNEIQATPEKVGDIPLANQMGPKATPAHNSTPTIYNIANALLSYGYYNQIASRLDESYLENKQSIQEALIRLNRISLKTEDPHKALDPNEPLILPTQHQIALILIEQVDYLENQDAAPYLLPQSKGGYINSSWYAADYYQAVYSGTSDKFTEEDYLRASINLSVSAYPRISDGSEPPVLVQSIGEPAYQISVSPYYYLPTDQEILQIKERQDNTYILFKEVQLATTYTLENNHNPLLSAISIRMLSAPLNDQIQITDNQDQIVNAILYYNGQIDAESPLGQLTDSTGQRLTQIIIPTEQQVIDYLANLGITADNIDDEHYSQSILTKPGDETIYQGWDLGYHHSIEGIVERYGLDPSDSGDINAIIRALIPLAKTLYINVTENDIAHAIRELNPDFTSDPERIYLPSQHQLALLTPVIDPSCPADGCNNVLAELESGHIGRAVKSPVGHTKVGEFANYVVKERVYGFEYHDETLIYALFYYNALRSEGKSTRAHLGKQEFYLPSLSEIDRYVELTNNGSIARTKHLVLGKEYNLSINPWIESQTWTQLADKLTPHYIEVAKERGINNIESQISRGKIITGLLKLNGLDTASTLSQPFSADNRITKLLQTESLKIPRLEELELKSTVIGPGTYISKEDFSEPIDLAIVAQLIFYNDQVQSAMPPLPTDIGFDKSPQFKQILSLIVAINPNFTADLSGGPIRLPSIQEIIIIVDEVPDYYVPNKATVASYEWENTTGKTITFKDFAQLIYKHGNFDSQTQMTDAEAIELAEFLKSHNPDIRGGWFSGNSYDIDPDETIRVPVLIQNAQPQNTPLPSSQASVFDEFVYNTYGYYGEGSTRLGAWFAEASDKTITTIDPLSVQWENVSDSSASLQQHNDPLQSPFGPTT